MIRYEKYIHEPKMEKSKGCHEMSFESQFTGFLEHSTSNWVKMFFHFHCEKLTEMGDAKGFIGDCTAGFYIINLQNFL